MQVEFEIAQADSIHLLFRTEWGGYPGLADRLRRLEAFAPSGALSVTGGSDELGSGHLIVADAEPGRITVTYELSLSPPEQSRLYHRASQLSTEGGHLLTGDLLPFIALGRTPRAGRQNARLWFSGLPVDWRVTSVERRAGTGYEIKDTNSAFFLVGPLRTRRSHVGPRSLTVAIYGRWPVPDDRLFDAIERIAGSLHRIAGEGWGAGDHLVGVGRVPVEIHGLSTGGQVIGPAGLVYLAGDAPAEVALAAWMRSASHELMHWYIPTGFRFGTEPPSWFAEGFTDYMALKALFAGGLLEPQTFLDEIGERLARYRESPLYGRRSLPEAQADFWEDDAYRYIYDGGAAAAFLLDLGFQDRRGSLERALRGIRRAAPITDEVLRAALADIPENGWIDAWLATGANPDWDARLARYRLIWKRGRLVTTDDWATDVLASIRP